MKIINKIKGWISSSPEEVRGANDSVQDLLSIRVPAGRVRFLYFIIVLSFLILIGRLQEKLFKDVCEVKFCTPSEALCKWKSNSVTIVNLHEHISV